MTGRFFDEWTLGDRIAHQPHRTVTETDNLLISALTHNPQPLHIDAEYAAGSEFGRIVVNGTFTFALMVGLSVGDTTLGTLVANLGYDKVRMPKPALLGGPLWSAYRGATPRSALWWPTLATIRCGCPSPSSSAIPCGRRQKWWV